MKVKTIIDNENGRKWEIYKHENKAGFPYPVYTVNYYEFFKVGGWRLISDGAKNERLLHKRIYRRRF